MDTQKGVSLKNFSKLALTPDSRIRSLGTPPFCVHTSLVLIRETSVSLGYSVNEDDSVLVTLVCLSLSVHVLSRFQQVMSLEGLGV